MTDKKEKKGVVIKKPRENRDVDEYRPFVAMRDFDRLFEGFRRDMDRMIMDPFYMPTLNLKMGHLPKIVSPRVDITDEGDHYLVKAELPGTKKEDLDITVEDNIISIKAEAKEEKKDEGKNYLIQERRSFSFHRAFELPEEVIADKTSGEMKDGVLRIKLPKKEPAPKKEAHKVKIQ